jgi:N-acetylglucosamine-6-phosphate deacetylase
VAKAQHPSPPPSYAIHHGTVIVPDAAIEHGTVLISNGRIEYAGAARATPPGYRELDARGGYVCPGLVEVHFHGAGRNSLDPPSARSFRAIADFLLSRGILFFLPTMMASEDVIRGLSKLIEETGLESRIPGLYVEGPFVSADKRGGIQEQYVRPIDLAYLDRLIRIAKRRIRLMTFAPELRNAPVLVRALVKRGILPCVGHTLATAAQCYEAVGAAEVNCTHLFNAMSGLDHREPGAAAFGLNCANAWVELNSDGTHVHPELINLTYHAKPRDRIVLISDAVISAGEEPGEYEYMGKRVLANDRGVYYADSCTLIGSRALLNQIVALFMKLTGAPIADAIRMATLNPMKMLGLGGRKGSLEPGKDADVVIFPKNLSRARVVIQDGKIIFPSRMAEQ